MDYAKLSEITKKYGVVMLDLSKATKAEIAANAERNIQLSLEHKEVAELFGKSAFDARTAKKISDKHHLNW